MKGSTGMMATSLNGSKSRDDPQWKLWNMEFSQDESTDHPRVRRNRSRTPPRKGRKPNKKNNNNKENNINNSPKKTKKKTVTVEYVDNSLSSSESVSVNDHSHNSNNTETELGAEYYLHSSIQTTKMYSVSFGTVETREYERILDVNPWCNGSGPSFGLGWKYNVIDVVEIDPIHQDGSSSSKNKKTGITLSPKRTNKKSLTDYFGLKKNNTNMKIGFPGLGGLLSSSSNASAATRSRSLHLSPLSPAQREDLAMELGYTKVEIKKNVIKVLRAQKQREEDNAEAKQAQQRALALAHAHGIESS